MIIGDRLRALREAKHLSQGDLERRTGLLRCYISRVENGHTVPALETLEKFAHAMEVPLYQLFYHGEKPPAAPHLTNEKSEGQDIGAALEKTRTYFTAFAACSVGSKNRTETCCCTWRARWHGPLATE